MAEQCTVGKTVLGKNGKCSTHLLDVISYKRRNARKYVHRLL